MKPLKNSIVILSTNIVKNEGLGPWTAAYFSTFMNIDQLRLFSPVVSSLELSNFHQSQPVWTMVRDDGNHRPRTSGELQVDDA